MTLAPQPSTFDKFWGNAGPGLFDFGAGIYSRNRARSEAADWLNRAQGPAYQGQMDAAQRVLVDAGSFDPRAAGAERLKARHGMLAGKDAADEAGLMRMLHSKGMLGTASFNPNVKSPLVSDFDPATMGGMQTGVSMNPHLAAFYAARNARDARMAAEAQDAGEAQLDRQLKRAGMLQWDANATRRADLDALRTQTPRSPSDMQMLKGISGILRDTGAFKALPGMIGGGMDWLKNSFGGGASTPAMGWSLDGQGTDFGGWYGW